MDKKTKFKGHKTFIWRLERDMSILRKLSVVCSSALLDINVLLSLQSQWHLTLQIFILLLLEYKTFHHVFMPVFKNCNIYFFGNISKCFIHLWKVSWKNIIILEVAKNVLECYFCWNQISKISAYRKLITSTKK